MKTLLAIPSLRASMALPVLALLAACGSDDADSAADDAAPIEVDGARFGDGASIDTSPEAIEMARQAAFAMVGGEASMLEAPAAGETTGELPADSVLSQALAGAATGSTQADCAAIAEIGNTWVDSLPASFPVYPEATVVEAAGTDQGGCNLRVINFATPVPRGEVMNFYYTRAAMEGYSTQRVITGGEDTLGGSRSAANFVVIAREREAGGSDVDLIVDGG